MAGLWPGAQFGIQAGVAALITDCPRDIPRMQRVKYPAACPTSEPATGRWAKACINKAYDGALADGI